MDYRKISDLSTEKVFRDYLWDHRKKEWLQLVLHTLVSRFRIFVFLFALLSPFSTASILADGTNSRAFIAQNVRHLALSLPAMEKAFEEKNYDVCASLNFDFHRTYVKLCNNEILIKAIRSIMKNTIWLWITSLYYTKSELIPLSLHEHQEIIEALQTHNALKAEEMVRKHITNVLGRSLELSVFSPEGHFVDNLK